jgi:hypothetical protein
MVAEQGALREGAGDYGHKQKDLWQAAGKP